MALLLSRSPNDRITLRVCAKEKETAQMQTGEIITDPGTAYPRTKCGVRTHLVAQTHSKNSDNIRTELEIRVQEEVKTRQQQERC